VTASPSAARVVVVGGGITGLAAAHRLLELRQEQGLPLDVLLLEAGDRLGGVIRTRRQSGFLLEEGPDSMITDKPWGRALAERIGLGQRLVGTQDEHRRSFVVRDGKLEPTPEGFYLLAPSMMLPLAMSRIFSPMGKARMAMDLFLPRRSGGGDESVGSFVTRRLGREALDRMAQPMVAGIYGADPGTLSLKATFPRFLQMEAEHGSVIRGMWSSRRGRGSGGQRAGGNGAASGARYGLFVSFDDGLQVLTEALAARLPAGASRTGARVTAVHPIASGAHAGWRVATPAFEVECGALIIALHAPDAAPLVRPFDPQLAAQLASIGYNTAATVSMAFREEDVAHRMDGFGFVVPAIEGLSIMGCTFCHRKYPGRSPAHHALLRAFWSDESTRLTDDDLVARTLLDFSRLLGIRSSPLLAHVSRWPLSMPQYTVGHLDQVGEIEARAGTHPGLALAGNAYRGIGIPDCVRSGESAAEAIAAQALRESI
jgi:oxygen-dependent protoporphyrinogen oxidase